MQMTRTMAAIWILTLAATAIAGVMAATQVFSLGWSRAHESPMLYTAIACAGACICLLVQQNKK